MGRMKFGARVKRAGLVLSSSALLFGLMPAAPLLAAESGKMAQRVDAALVAKAKESPESERNVTVIGQSAVANLSKVEREAAVAASTKAAASKADAGMKTAAQAALTKAGVKATRELASGFVAKVKGKNLAALASDPSVVAVEEDAPMVSQITAVDATQLRAEGAEVAYQKVVGAPSAWSQGPLVRGLAWR